MSDVPTFSGRTVPERVAYLEAFSDRALVEMDRVLVEVDRVLVELDRLGGLVAAYSEEADIAARQARHAFDRVAALDALLFKAIHEPEPGALS